MTTQGSNSKMLRTKNRRVILWKLFNNGPMSRIELAKECRLTGAAITIIAKELLECGKIIENGERLQRNLQGRKEVLLDINYDNFLACNINIERDNIHFSLCSLKGIILEIKRPTKEMLGVEYLRINIEHITRGYEKRLVGIGVGVIGAVDEENGELVNSYGLFENGLNLKAELSRYFDVPVYVANNVRAHAKAIINDERNNFLYIKHGPGLGCAIVINGKVLDGHTNRAAEVSQVDIGNDGNTLESYILESSLLARSKYSDVKELYAAYATDPKAKQILDTCIAVFVYSVTNMNLITDPEQIIIAGGIFYGELTYEAFRKALAEKNAEIAAKTEVLSEETNIKGIASARLVFNKVFFDV